MKNFRARLVLLLILGATFTACKKEKQDDPVVEQTTTIPQGNGIVETAQKMPNGTTVVFSNWITKTNSEWTGYGTSTISTEINTTSLTDAIRNNGIVLVYYEYGTVRQLPVTIIDNFILYFSFGTGVINVRYSYLNGAIIASGLGNTKLRYILIPSSSFAVPGQGRMSTPVDYNDYNAVCAYYGIPK